MFTSSTLFTATLIISALLAATAVAQGSGHWTTGAPMPSERTEVSVAEMGDKIYVLGGFRCELRNLRPCPRPLEPRGRHPARGAPRRRRWTEQQDLSDRRLCRRLDAYRRASRVTLPVTPGVLVARMPTPRGALAAAVIDGKIHAVGGNSWRDRNRGAHEVYDPAANRWSALAALRTPRDHLASPRSAGAFMPLAAASTEILHAISRLTKPTIRKTTAGSG